MLFQEQLNQVAHFLDNRGLPEKALEIATDVDYRFELAVQLGMLDTALEIAQASESEAKWRQLGELALSSGKLDVSLIHETAVIPSSKAIFPISRLMDKIL